MIGSETFIIVALRWTENRTPGSIEATSALMNARSAEADMKVASTTSPSRYFRPSLSTVSLPAASVKVILAAPACAAVMVADFSFAKKSLPGIEATQVFDAAVHSPIECGFFLAYSLTALAERRSELPSRRTGFTAEPLIAS